MAITEQNLKDRNIENKKAASVKHGNVVFIPEADGVIPYFRPEGFDTNNKRFPLGIPGRLITDLDELDELLNLLM